MVHFIRFPSNTMWAWLIAFGSSYILFLTVTLDLSSIMSLVNSKFQLLSMPVIPKSKRATSEAALDTSVQPVKIPRADAIVMSEAKRPLPSSRRLPVSAPVDVCVYKYTDHAPDLWDLFQSQDEVCLFQCQISHQAQRSITFQMRDGFNDFLASANSENDCIPTSVQKLESIAGVKLVISDRTDPENVGFQPWRVAFYCTDACNFLKLLDSWFQYKEKVIACEQPFEVVIHPHIGIDLSSLADALSYDQLLVAVCGDVCRLSHNDQPLVLSVCWCIVCDCKFMCSVFTLVIFLSFVRCLRIYVNEQMYVIRFCVSCFALLRNITPSWNHVCSCRFTFSKRSPLSVRGLSFLICNCKTIMK